MNPANATNARFIKLGGKGQWESGCIEATPGTIRLGFNNPHHQACLNDDWGPLKEYMRTEKKKTKGKVTEIANQVRDFYNLDEHTLWITFYRRQLYWCFASPEVVVLEDGSRVRETIGGWRNTSLGGKRLLVETLNGSLTKTQGFQGTICSVGAIDYLKLRLCDQVLPEVQAAEVKLRDLQASLVALIRGLNWKDFELLCDLVFANAGWQRIASLGGTEKSIDLDLISPVTGRRLFVQVKSQSDKGEFQAYLEHFNVHDQYDEMYFIVHSPQGDVSSWTTSTDPKIKIYVAEDMARLTVSAGLTEWLIKKCS